MLLRKSCVLVVMLASVVVAFPREPQPTQAPQASNIKFSKETLTLDEALAELHKQTDNVIIDRRTNKDNPKLTFRQTTGTYWQMLDAIGSQGVGFSAYQEGGVLYLVDSPYRKLTTHYSGIFRFAVKSVSVVRDDETRAHACHVDLSTAWEPRFQLLYLNLDDAEVSFGKQQEKLERQASRPVSGVSATEIELSMKAPPRTVAVITALKGTVRAVGIPKMIEFAFTNLDAKPITIDKVQASLTYVNKAANRWTVDLQCDNPPGSEMLESYQQTWMDNNRVWLSWGLDPKTKKPYELEPSGRSPQDAKAGTKIRYYFTPRGNTPLPALGANVALHYRTPNRVLAFTVPFEFQNLPLP
jgi:hypothetical protein